MKIKNFEKPEENMATLTIEVSKEEFDKALDKAYRQDRFKYNVPGFRKGRATRKVIEGMFGETVFYETAINMAIPKAFDKAVDEKELHPILDPQVKFEQKNDDGGFDFTVTTALFPTYTMGEYKGLKAVKKNTEVTEETIDNEIEFLRQRNARIETTDRAAQSGDVVVIDFEGFSDGVAFEGGKGEKMNLELGSGTFVPGFEDQVIGMSANEEKDVNIKFPEDYVGEMAGKDAVFKVKVHEVKGKELPEVDDDFVKDVSSFDTVEQLRADIKERLTEVYAKSVKDEFESAIMTQVIDGVEIQIPSLMIDNQVNLIVEEQKFRMQSQGISFEDYTKITGQSEETMREMLREPARRMLIKEIALAEIMKQEDIEASPQEIEDEYTKLSQQYNIDVKTLKEKIHVSEVIIDVQRRRAEEFIYENAVALDAEEAPEEE